MTPPPSSQIPNTRTAARTPTPADPQLTSPPPTAKLIHQASALSDSAAALYSQDQIDNASADELRSMVTELCSALRDVRISAAHHKLQYNMAVMESRESANRMAVELTIAQSEVDVLQRAEERRRSSMASPAQNLQSPVHPANATIMLSLSELNRTCQMLQNDNDALRELLEEQTMATEHKQGEITCLVEEVARLKTRIRQNRAHVAPFLPLQMDEQGSPRSLLGTPHPTPRQRLNRAEPPHSIDRGRGGQHNFEALLLADKMLSQETATAPSTPARSYAPRSRAGHTRGAQSMSSLPQTPNRRSHLHTRTPPTFSAVNIPQSAPPVHYPHPPPSHIRRESSNSTITASSVDEEEAFTEREEEPEVQESQASQMATSMLRRVAGPPPSTKKMMAVPPSSQSSQSLVQSRIFGHVKKGGVRREGEFEKRRLPSEGMMQASPPKRGRTDQGVGLGIGGYVRD